MSRGFEPDGTHEIVEIIDHALIEAIELRSLLVADTGVAANGGKKAGGGRRIDALEQLQKNQTVKLTRFRGHPFV